MNKKGGHVDWVISMGIFIVYIFALFILLRPGIRPIYKPETLLDNLQEQFEEYTFWTIKRVPLFIRVCEMVPVEDGFVSATVTIDDEANSWSCSSTVKDDLSKIYSKPLKCGDLQQPESTYLKEGKSIPFYFYFHKTGDESPRFGEVCKPDNPEYCIAEIGVAEDIKGINSNLLDDVTSTNIEYYKSLKESWKVPDDKDFAIWSDTKIIGAEPYEQANVFVRRLKTHKITGSGEKTPVTIYLRIW